MTATFAPEEDRAYRVAAHAEFRHPGHPDQKVHGRRGPGGANAKIAQIREATDDDFRNFSWGHYTTREAADRIIKSGFDPNVDQGLGGQSFPEGTVFVGKLGTSYMEQMASEFQWQHGQDGLVADGAERVTLAVDLKPGLRVLDIPRDPYVSDLVKAGVPQEIADGYPALVAAGAEFATNVASVKIAQAAGFDAVEWGWEEMAILPSEQRSSEFRHPGHSPQSVHAGGKGGGDIDPVDAISDAVGERVKVRYSMGGGKNHSVEITTVGQTVTPAMAGGSLKVGDTLPGTSQRVASMIWSKKTGEVKGIVVEPKYQRRGVATHMFAEVTAESKRRGWAEPVHSDMLTSDGQGFVSSLKAVQRDEFRHPGHSPQSVHAGKSRNQLKGLHDPDGGFTTTSTGRPIQTGWSVAKEGTSSFMSADEFNSNPVAAKAFIKEFARTAKPGENIGGWHDPHPNTPGQGIVLDKVRIFPSDQHDAAKAFAVANNQKSMANLDAITAGDWDNAIEDTGGSGDTLSDHGQGTSHRSRAGEAGQRDDRGRAGRVRRGDVRRDDGPPGVFAAHAEVRHPGHPDQKNHGRRGPRISPVDGDTGKGSSIHEDLTLSVLSDKVAAGSVAKLQENGNVTMEEAQANMVARADEAFARANGGEMAGEHWYEEAGMAAQEQAVAAGLHRETGVAITAALSPGCEWKENSRQANATMQALGRRKEPLSDSDIESVNFYASSRKKLPGDPKGGPFTGPEKSSARVKPGDSLEDVYNKDPLLAGVAIGRAAGAQASYGYDKFEKAARLAFTDDPAQITNILSGTKTRSFYNNMSDPLGTAGDVTIDVHMMRAITTDSYPPNQVRRNWVGMAKSNTTSTPAASGARLGAMPAMADATRSACAKFNATHGTSLLPHQFQAVVWTEQITQFPPARVTQVVSGNPNAWANQYGSGTITPGGTP